MMLICAKCELIVAVVIVLVVGRGSTASVASAIAMATTMTRFQIHFHQPAGSSSSSLSRTGRGNKFPFYSITTTTTRALVAMEASERVAASECPVIRTERAAKTSELLPPVAAASPFSLLFAGFSVTCCNWNAAEALRR